MTKRKNRNNTKCWTVCKNSDSYIAGVNLGTATVGNSLQFLEKLHTKLPYDPAIAL